MQNSKKEHYSKCLNRMIIGPTVWFSFLTNPPCSLTSFSLHLVIQTNSRNSPVFLSNPMAEAVATVPSAAMELYGLVVHPTKWLGFSPCISHEVMAIRKGSQQPVP